ncbi:hypothetical protein [Actinoplanes sp. NPDC026670]
MAGEHVERPPAGWFVDWAAYVTSACDRTIGGLPPNTAWTRRIY